MKYVQQQTSNRWSTRLCVVKQYPLGVVNLPPCYEYVYVQTYYQQISIYNKYDPIENPLIKKKQRIGLYPLEVIETLLPGSVQFNSYLHTSEDWLLATLEVYSQL